jgi:hypothetical protein
MPLYLNEEVSSVTNTSDTSATSMTVKASNRKASNNGLRVTVSTGFSFEYLGIPRHVRVSLPDVIASFLVWLLPSLNTASIQPSCFPFEQKSPRNMSDADEGTRSCEGRCGLLVGMPKLDSIRGRSACIKNSFVDEPAYNPHASMHQTLQR